MPHELRATATGTAVGPSAVPVSPVSRGDLLEIFQEGPRPSSCQNAI